jgi:hypothetical protein
MWGELDSILKSFPSVGSRGLSTIMVWSAGPDKVVDPTVQANAGANKNNVLSWNWK